MEAAAEAEKGRQSLIDGGDLFPGKLTKYAPDPALADGSQAIDQRERILCKSAAARCERRIEKSLARSSGYWHHTHEGETLVAGDVRITDHNARSEPTLFVTDGWVQFDQDDY